MRLRSFAAACRPCRRPAEVGALVANCYVIHMPPSRSKIGLAASSRRESDLQEVAEIKALLNTSPTPRRAPLDTSLPAADSASLNPASPAATDDDKDINLPASADSASLSPTTADAATGDGDQHAPQKTPAGWSAVKQAFMTNKPAEKKPALLAVVAAAQERLYAMTREEIEAVEQRFLTDAKACEQHAEAIPVDFDRQLGIAINKVAPSKESFHELLLNWDNKGTGLKRVDFRRQLRGVHNGALKMTASGNSSIDKLFDSITGGGGAAAASLKDLEAHMWPCARRARVPDPRTDKLIEEATGKRAEAAAVRTILDALDAADAAVAQLEGQTGEQTPVVAQIGALLLKRNMKVGEVMVCALRQLPYSGLHP